MPVGETAHVTGPSRTNLLRLWLIRTILLMALIGGLTALRNFTEYELPWTALWTVLLAMVPFRGRRSLTVAAAIMGLGLSLAAILVVLSGAR